MKSIITFFSLFFCITLFGQEVNFELPVSVDEAAGSVDSSALVDIKSTTKGILIPRMSATERAAIMNPAPGLMVYDLVYKSFYHYNGTVWVRDDHSATNEHQDLVLTGHELKITSGNMVTLPDNVNDADADPANELQTLSLSGSDLTISGGNTVALPSSSGLWSTGAGSDIYYQSGKVGIGTNTAIDNSLYVDHGGSDAAAEFYNDYTGSSVKKGLDILLTNGGTGTKTGLLVQAIAGSSTETKGIFSYVIAGASGGTYQSISGSISGEGTAIRGTAIDAVGKAAIFDGTVEVDGNAFFKNSDLSHNQVAIYPEATSSEDSTSLFFGEDDNGTYGMSIMYDGVGNELQIFGKANSTGYGPHFSMDRNSGNTQLPGAVTIGGTDFASGFALSVNGKAICEEMQIELIGDWPDYVFKADYELKSLEETANFISTNGHLPGIPSAQEVKENGIAVGDMQKRMMEKIEELTLHVIQLNEENKTLRARLDSIENIK